MNFHITESKKELFRTRQNLVIVVGHLEKSILTRCALEGCVYGYEGVHAEPSKHCLYCKNKRPKGVSRNAWRSPGQTVDEMLAAKEKNDNQEEK
jgi:hypothetical protein